jgi:hypothetical protein
LTDRVRRTLTGESHQDSHPSTPPRPSPVPYPRPKRIGHFLVHGQRAPLDGERVDPEPGMVIGDGDPAPGGSLPHVLGHALLAVVYVLVPSMFGRTSCREACNGTGENVAATKHGLESRTGFASWWANTCGSLSRAVPYGLRGSLLAVRSRLNRAGGSPRHRDLTWGALTMRPARPNRGSVCNRAHDPIPRA